MRYFVVYALLGNAWQQIGTGWEGRGGEAVIQQGIGRNVPVYVLIWDPHRNAWLNRMLPVGGQWVGYYAGA